MKMSKILSRSSCSRNIFVIILLFVMVLAACNPMEKEWNRAIKENTVEGYDTFMANYPDSKYLQEARNRKAMLLPNVVLQQIDKSVIHTSANVYGIPEKVKTEAGVLLAEFLTKGGWITGLNAYFYLDNRGARGDEVIKVTYADDLGTSTAKEKNIPFADSTSYTVKVTITFESNVSWMAASYGSSRSNTVTIILPTGKKDSFATRIPSWEGSISGIEITEN